MLLQNMPLSQSFFFFFSKLEESETRELHREALEDHLFSDKN